MAETAPVKVTVDAEKIKDRMREFLAMAWDDGWKAGADDQKRWRKDSPLWSGATANPYRD